MDARLANNRAGERDALPLAARKLARPAFEQFADFQQVRDPADASFDVAFRGPAHAQRIGDVFGHGHMRIERVVLKYHGDVAPARGYVIYALGADEYVAPGRVFEPREHPERRSLAAPRRAEQHYELARPDREIEPVDRRALAEHLRHVFESHIHIFSDCAAARYPFTAPSERPRTRWRCTIRANARMGSMAMTPAALITPHLVSY